MTHKSSRRRIFLKYLFFFSRRINFMDKSRRDFPQNTQLKSRVRLQGICSKNPGEHFKKKHTQFSSRQSVKKIQELSCEKHNQMPGFFINTFLEKLLFCRSIITFLGNSCYIFPGASFSTEQVFIFQEPQFFPKQMIKSRRVQVTEQIVFSRRKGPQEQIFHIS